MTAEKSRDERHNLRNRSRASLQYKPQSRVRYMCRSAGGEPIRGLSEGLQIPWSKSRDMTSWARGGDLERCWHGRVVWWSRGMNMIGQVGHVV